VPSEKEERNDLFVYDPGKGKPGKKRLLTVLKLTKNQSKGWGFTVGEAKF